VVKLRPSEFTQSEEGGSDESAQEESEEFQDASDEKIATRKNKGRDKRPHLVLHQNMVGGESTFSDSMPLLNAEPAGNIEHPSAFDKFGADDLGVVSGGTTSGASPTSDEMTMFNNAYREYSNKRIDAALNQFAEFVKTYPNHAFADDALYWRGECFLTQGKFLYAIGELERLTRRYPASDKASSALFRIGFAYDKLRDYAKAAEYYFEVVGKFPGTEGARRASSRMAELKNSAASGGPLVPTSGTR
jgi:tol-pal system protein YbgF